MARVVYLIVSHTAPGQIARLAAAIRKCSPRAEIVIHHDGSKTAEPAPEVEGTHLIPDPVPVQWGDFSQVSMVLHATQWLCDNLSFDWLVMVSGQDYPVQPLERFEARLAGSHYDAFIGHFDGRDAAYWPKHTALRRYYYRYFPLPRFAHYYLLPDPIKRAFRTFKRRLNGSQPLFFLQTGHSGRPAMMGVRCMNVPFNERFRCYGGPQWLNLSRKSVDHLHRLVRTRPDIVAHYRRTHIPDESFVQSVLVNDPELRICNDACRFVNWDEERQTASPSIITIDDLETVLASGQPFARKFDAAVDHAVLDAIDLRLGIGAQRPAAEPADR